MLGVMLASTYCASLEGLSGSDAGTDADAVDASTDESTSVEGGGDAAVDADAGPCGARVPFTSIAPINELGDAGDSERPRLSADELTIYFAVPSTPNRIFYATRPTTSSPFSTAEPLAAVNVVYNANDPSVSSGGLTMFLTSGQASTRDIYISRRDSGTAAFTAPALVTALSSSEEDRHPFLALDERDLWLASSRGAGSNLRIYRAAFDGGDFAAPVQILELASPTDDAAPVLSADGLTIYFASQRTGSQARDVWRASRSVRDGVFSTIENVSELNSASDDLPGWLSPDNCRLYFSTSRGSTSGEHRLWLATRVP